MVRCLQAHQRHLILTKQDVKDEGRFRVNPPIAGEEDRQALKKQYALEHLSNI